MIHKGLIQINCRQKVAKKRCSATTDLAQF